MRACLAFAALLLFLAGCGSAVDGVPPILTSTSIGSPPSRAAGLASHLVAELALPAGVRPEHVTRLPPGLAYPGAPAHGWARAVRVFAVHATPRAVWTALLAHAPFSEPLGDAIDPIGVSVTAAAPAPGVDASTVSVSVAPLSRTMTVVDAYADAAWLPVRTPAEHLDPGDFRAVTASVTRPSSGPVTRTSTSATVIARMTSFLNGLAPVPLLAESCPPGFSSFSVRFVPKDSHDPVVVLTGGGCPRSYLITVNGRAQPGLWDRDGGLQNLARSLMGLPATG